MNAAKRTRKDFEEMTESPKTAKAQRKKVAGIKAGSKALRATQLDVSIRDKNRKPGPEIRSPIKRAIAEFLSDWFFHANQNPKADINAKSGEEDFHVCLAK